ncbi:hypothetical protein [Crinalium epipsammum]|uniref:hypothetical protein n=1 Tax=Crinalium epipsammum TaxID=241425 RepID=UPI0002F3F278|nr:hypothetical protein [Crinalium epipsammum]
MRFLTPSPSGAAPPTESLRDFSALAVRTAMRYAQATPTLTHPLPLTNLYFRAYFWTIKRFPSITTTQK